MRNITTILIMLMLCGATQAMSLEGLILGDAPPAVVTDSGIETDPTYFVLGIGMGPDIDSPDNEFSVLFGYRHNMFEFGPTVHIWPGSDADPAWGVYALRHLSYDTVILGKPFVGFDTTVAGSGGGMYAFVAGTDVEITEGIILRTAVEFRTFEGALAASHRDESDETVGKINILFRF